MKQNFHRDKHFDHKLSAAHLKFFFVSGARNKNDSIHAKTQVLAILLQVNLMNTKDFMYH